MATDFATPLEVAAAQMHEAMLAYVAAGFTRAEAITIVIGMANHG